MFVNKEELIEKIVQDSGYDAQKVRQVLASLMAVMHETLDKSQKEITIENLLHLK